MVKHKISVRHGGVTPPLKLQIPLLKQCIRIALFKEGVDVPCEVNVLVTDDKGIRKINREFRGIDKPTDVLSFPMYEFTPPGWAHPGADAVDIESGLVPLGDMVLSAEQIDRQARTFEHTREHETAYLTIHSTLHLLGYDHIDEAEEKKHMREREEAIMEEIGVRKYR